MGFEHDNKAHNPLDDDKEYRPYDVIRVLGIERPDYADMKKRLNGVPKESHYSEGDLLAFRVLDFYIRTWKVSVRDLNKHDLSLVFKTCQYPFNLLKSLIMVLYWPEDSNERHLLFLDESKDALKEIPVYEKRTVEMREMIKRHQLALAPKSMTVENTEAEQAQASLNELLQSTITSAEEAVSSFSKKDIFTLM